MALFPTGRETWGEAKRLEWCQSDQAKALPVLWEKVQIHLSYSCFPLQNHKSFFKWRGSRTYSETQDDHILGQIRRALSCGSERTVRLSPWTGAAWEAGATPGNCGSQGRAQSGTLLSVLQGPPWKTHCLQRGASPFKSANFSPKMIHLHSGKHVGRCDTGRITISVSLLIYLICLLTVCIKRYYLGHSSFSFLPTFFPFLLFFFNQHSYY